MRFAMDSGITLIDAAQSYPNAEVRFGKALKDGYRDKCFVATKVSNKYTKEDVAKAIEESLEKLGVDYVDLYQVHGWWDPKYPIEETMEAMARVREQGKARYIGVSNFSAHQMARTLTITPFQSNQPLYNMLNRKIEAEDIPFCKAHGIGLVTYSAMAQGVLSGKYRAGHAFSEDDWRSRADKFKGDTFAQHVQIAGRLAEVAADKGVSLGQLAIAWILREEAVSCLLTGAKHPHQITEQLGALDVRLTDEDLARIDTILADAPAW
jgi:aryl-alcohol dehydrogenase-like predicted oxidoreductase